MKTQITLITVFILTALLSAAPAVKEVGKNYQGPALKKLTGIRIGATYIFTNDQDAGRELQQVMNDEGLTSNMISQFGWQFEKRFGNPGDKATGVLAFVLLGGGFNQGIIIPSATSIMGVRLANGFEFGGGPNLVMSKTAAGNLDIAPGFAWTCGYSPSIGRLLLPVTVAAVQTESGIRLSTLVGIVW